jgi:acyl-CoA synthetase (AMP-forming)/AMP-acid ligase II
VKIVDDAGRECPPETPGEIVVQTLGMARGYWNNHAATLETFRDGWCHTGDIGLLDADGMLYLVDRKKDVIISGGENIYSREVEDALLTHPAVAEVAVIGIPDAKWGESVCACVVLRAGHTVTDAELVEHARSQIARYKVPRTLLFRAELPKMPTGKIDKKALRQQHAR